MPALSHFFSFAFKKRLMYCKVESKEIDEINSTNILPQTSFWAQVKNQQGFIPYAFKLVASDDVLDPNRQENKKITDDLLILIKYISTNYCFAYIPYGPKIQPHDENYGKFLEELSEVLKSHLPSNCILIRYDLPWKNQWAMEDDYSDNRNFWLCPPSVYTQEFRLNFNTNNWNLLKSPSDILPTNTFFLDLKQREDQLLQHMKPKTRYNIRLAFRKGIQVKEYGIDKLDEWYALYKETCDRNNLTLHNEDYFKGMLALQKNNPEDIKINLLMADIDGNYLAAMFLIQSNKRGTYLYGASSSANRHLMATYAIQWEAIKLAKKSGCKEYDMFGSAPNASKSHPMHGLYRFKSGFGGHMFHRMGCWDYPLIKDEYQIFKAQEVNNQKYHV